MYAAFIVFIIPGLALALNHLLLLFVSASMFIAFKMLIGKEEEFLAKEFGIEFEEYRNKVPQLVPFIRV
jgi:protein-S-isoprenylcysteine O-methyltransferase Ste14